MPNPSVAAVGSTHSGSGSTAPTIPSGVVAGSLVILLAMNSTSSTFGPPAGFTEIASQTASPRHKAWWKRATGPESGTYTVTGGALNNMGGVALRIADDDGSSSPILAATDVDVTAGGGMIGPPLDIADVPAGALLIHSLAPSAGRTYTAETGFVIHSDNAAAQRIMASSKTQPSAGPTGTIDGAVVGGNATISGILFAIKAAPDVVGGRFLALL